ncbi:hypothetical protein P171DRAFT_487059 [Karstenula rhodostoma CBS 690.94]|uniref:Extracellular membrane protein CFEM domain-containing protein n=1 Tax=Karstenula rhodostoma CBS 690.94 TaxID=1392251 RepID=A0A9P4UAC8_9PLEO|nr:hypothetical protein P171DRAFT_487059 [Karstenula rhodostoma CBS 690.94]
MKLLLVSSVAVWLLAASAAASGPTKIYIDSVPEYDLLQSCAEHEVSMAYGCGDGSQLTSYACFCYQSSAYYSRMISTRVNSACSKIRGQDSSAVEVFSKYCQLADIEKVTTTGEAALGIETSNTSQDTTDSASSEPTPSSSSTQSTSQPSPASTPARTTPTPTSTPSSQTSDPPSPSPEKKDNTAAIAAGVTVPIVLIALGLVGFLLHHHRRKRNPHAAGELPAHPENQATEVSGAAMTHEKESYRHIELEGGVPQELDSGVARGKLAAADRDGMITHLLANGSGS